MAILFIVFAVAMAVGTFVENSYDTDTARIWVYNTWWFEAIMGLFVPLPITQKRELGSAYIAPFVGVYHHRGWGYALLWQ